MAKHRRLNAVQNPDTAPQSDETSRVMVNVQATTDGHVVVLFSRPVPWLRLTLAEVQGLVPAIVRAIQQAEAQIVAQGTQETRES